MVGDRDLPGRELVLLVGGLSNFVTGRGAVRDGGLVVAVTADDAARAGAVELIFVVTGSFCESRFGTDCASELTEVGLVEGGPVFETGRIVVVSLVSGEGAVGMRTLRAPPPTRGFSSCDFMSTVPTR